MKPQTDRPEGTMDDSPRADPQLHSSTAVERFITIYGNTMYQC